MKIRTGFVSNSSSASFIIAKADLSENQMKKLLNYDCKDGDFWEISETDSLVKGWTIMDNGDMSDFMRSLKINGEHVNWEDW